MTKGTRSRHVAESRQAVRPRRNNSEHEQSPTLPKTSRFRAHDHEGDQMHGCLGAPARREADNPDVADDWSVLS